MKEFSKIAYLRVETVLGSRLYVQVKFVPFFIFIEKYLFLFYMLIFIITGSGIRR